MTGTTLIQIGQAARVLRVPVAWLRGEAESGRIPSLRAGKVILVDVDVVARILESRARGEKAVVNAQ